MSFIRCWSNPESLYVYQSSDGVHMSHFPQQELIVPLRDFNRVCLAWSAGNWTESGNLAVKEIEVNERTNKPLTKRERALTDKSMALTSRMKTGYRIGIYFKGKLKLILWAVTWAYVVNNCVHEDHKGKRRIRRS